MNAYLAYFVETNFSLLLFFIAYELLLAKETHFGFKRAYILFGIIASLLLPFIEIKLPESPVAIVDQVAFENLMERISFTNQPLVTNPGTVSPLAVAGWSYLFVSGALLIIFLVRLVRLIAKLKIASSYRHANCRVVHDPTNESTFSFFNNVCLGQADQLSEAEKEQILQHEIVHIKNWHSLDIIFMEMLKIAFWMNPVVYFLKSRLLGLHEFSADEVVAKDLGPDSYCALLTKTALASSGIPLAHHFNSALVLKRISMIRATKKKISLWKLFALAAFVASVFVVISCREEFTKQLPLSLAEEKMPPTLSEQLRRLKETFPKSEFVVIERTKEGWKTISALMQRADWCNTVFTSIFEDGSEYPPSPTLREFAIVELGNRKARLRSLPKNETDLFSHVDEPATPILGLDRLDQALRFMINYPKEEKAKGIEGIVQVECIVGTSGKITDANVIKGINENLDTEAVRVVLQVAPMWYVAVHQNQIVRQRVVVPVTFSLKK